MNKAWFLAICMLSASFVGCIEELEKLEEKEEDSEGPKEFLYAAIDDVNDGNWGKLCKMDVFVLEDNVITLADETELKECTDEFNFENETVPVLFNFTISNYKEVKINGTIASNSGPIYEVTANLEICVKNDTDPWECETEENDVTYYTKVRGQWIDITDEWLEDSSLEQGESAPIATFFVEQDSTNVYHVTVVKVSRQENLEDFSFFLKDESGSTYVAGNGFGEIAMQIIDGKEHGIDTAYQGDDQQLKDRVTNIDDDNGKDFPVHFSDNDRDGKLSSGDQFLVYGPEAGPAQGGWKLDIQYDLTGDVSGSAKLGEVVTVYGCTYMNAYNYNEDATEDDGSCEYEKKTKIGFMNPKTGPLEPDAYGFWWGADQAINDLNAIYPEQNFELIEVDSGCDSYTAIDAAQNLVNEGVVAVVGAACSGASMGANEILSAYGIPMISYASTNPGLSDDEAYPLFYRVVPSDAIQGPAGADMIAYDGIGSGELAIIHMTNDYGSGLADSVKAAWEADGHTLCGEGMQGYAEDTTDFASLADSIVNDDTCTAVYLSSYIQDAARIIEELHEQGYTGHIYAGDGPAGPDLYNFLEDKSHAEDLVVTAPRAGYTHGDFESRYDQNAAVVGSIKTYVITAYDTTMIIGHAIANQDDYSLTDSIEAIGTDYEGASGLINFLDNGDVSGAGYDICTYDGDGNYDCNLFWTFDEGIQEEKPDTIKIGFMNPKTGPLEEEAHGFWWGADQAINDLNAIYPDLNFELIEVDSGCDGNKASQAAQTLVDSGVVAVVGAACSGASMSANEVLSAAGIPMISYASTSPGLSDDAAYPLFYRVVASDATQGVAGADMIAYDGIGSGELTILHVDNHYGVVIADAVESAWEEDENELCSAGRQGYEEAATDFSAMVTAIVDDPTCEAVYLSSHSTDAAGILEELNEQGWTGAIYTSDGIGGMEIYEKLQDNSVAEGVVMSQFRGGNTYGDLEERYDEAVEADELGAVNFKIYILTAYDTTMIVGDAFAKSYSEGTDLNENIGIIGTNYEGASGLITFLDNGDGIGNGYDFCVYDGVDDYDCNLFWTFNEGIQQY